MNRLFGASSAIGLLALAVGSGCTEPDGRLNVDLVQVPGTASGYEAKVVRPEISFTDTLIDFGNIAEGSISKHVFYFQNTGKSDLLISDVSANCGCTVARNWPRTPLAPSEKGSIEISFNSRGREGENSKTISVVTNTVPSTTELVLRGHVSGPSDPEIDL
jgi:hypothetical protein